jgi:DNA-directed RNA polymerase specialized sigma24 family protein
MALDILTEEEQEAFILIKGMGCTSAQAAQITDVPASTIRSRLGQAREKLAIRLESYGYLA